MGGFQAFTVVLPPGTTVVGEPRGCENRDLTLPFSASGCAPGALRAGESLLLVLDLKIVGPVTGPGKVTRTFAPGLTVDTRDDRDTNAANNSADITVQVTANAPALPATGTPTAALVAGAVSMVIIGGLLVLASRRSRQR
jgi:LPXTG-motif cell wall-anchored protein